METQRVIGRRGTSPPKDQLDEEMQGLVDEVEGESKDLLSDASKEFRSLRESTSSLFEEADDIDDDVPPMCSPEWRKIARRQCAWQRITLFMLNPQNIAAVTLIICFFISMAGMVLIETVDWFVHFGRLEIQALFSLVGLGYGILYTVRRGNLVKQIDRFRSLNRKMRRQLDKLEGCQDKMNTANDLIHEELEQFSELREALAKMAEESHTQIMDCMKEATGMLEGMKEQQVKQARLLLKDRAQYWEFRDKDAGMNEKEFARFIKGIPKEYQKRLEEMNITWRSLACGAEELDSMQIADLVDKLEPSLQMKKQQALGMKPFAMQTI